MQTIVNSTFEAYFDAAPVKIIICNEHGECTKFNKKWLTFRGRKLEEELNKGWESGVHPEDLGPLLSLYKASFDEKVPFEAEYRLKRYDGIYRNILFRAEPLYHQSGGFAGYIGSCFDITEHKQADADRDRINMVLDETSAMAKVGGWEYHVFTHKNIWTKEVYHIHEVDYNYVPHIKESIEFYHPDDREILLQAYNSLFLKGLPFDLELRLITAKGNQKWVKIQGKAHYEGERISRLIGAFQDITEQKLAALALKESERKLRFVLNGLPVAVYLTDANGYITDYNDSAAELWGRQPVAGQDRWCGSHKLFTKTGEPLLHEECPMAIAVKNNKEIYGEEAMLEQENGHRINFIAFATPYQNNIGTMEGAMNVMVDITDRKLIEERLTSLSFVARKTSNGVIITDSTKKITWVNPGFTRITGYTTEEAIGKTPAELLQFDKSDPIVINDMRKALAAGEPFRGELLNKGKTGAEYWADIDIQPLINPVGKLVGYISVQSDITEIKFMQQALRKSETKLRAILDSTTDENILIDKDFRIISYNKVAAQNIRMWYGRNVGLGEAIWEYVLPSLRAEFESCFNTAMKGVPTKIEREFTYGEVTNWYELVFYPVYSNTGDLIGAALSTKDIDHRKRSDIRVQEQNRQLREIAFTQSHTLRRPVANILGLWRLIKQEMESGKGDVAQLYELLSHLGRSAEETDEVIKRIIAATYEVKD